MEPTSQGRSLFDPTFGKRMERAIELANRANRFGFDG